MQLILTNFSHVIELRLNINDVNNVIKTQGTEKQRNRGTEEKEKVINEIKNEGIEISTHLLNFAIEAVFLKTKEK